MSSSMDSFFLLGAAERRQFLRTAGRLLGCAYICSWCRLNHPPLPASHMISADGWHQLEEEPASSSSSGIISLRLFDAYRRSLSSIQDGRVPGLAYMGGMPYYVEIRDADLINLASTDVQRRFYQEAGIKAAVFVGCRSGEIELGMMMPPNMNLQANLQQVFSQDFIQSQLRDNLIEYTSQLGGGGGGGGGGDFIIPQQNDTSRLSSSPSSLRSLSVGSPDTSPPLLPATTSPLAPEAPFSQLYHFPIPMGHGDEAMTRALMLAVISSTSTTTSSSSPPPPPLSPPVAYQVLQQQQAYRGGGRWRVGDQGGAFRVYNRLLVAPKLEAELNMPGQRMIKKGIDILRRISMMRMEAQMQEHYRPASNTQLHHMISERRRREKLNENFHALRLLLPPGSKKDKTSVLANTRNFLNSLKAQIKELEERNQMLETQLEDVAVADDETDVSDSNERVQVRIISRPADSTSSEAAQRTISLRLIVREEELEMTDLVVRVLGYLQQMRGDHHGITLLSIDASAARSPPTSNAFGRANLRLQIKGTGDWDEETFKEGVRKAVNGVLDGRRRASAGPSVA